mgnify:CR=1 FL=1
MGRGQLLHGVMRRQQDEGHSYKQDENDPHGYCPPYPLAPCRAHGGRATVQERYTAIPIPCNLFSYAISNEAATPNEPERSLFFSVVIRIAWYRVRRGVSPSPAAGYDAERIYHAYAGLREYQ